MKLMKNWIKTMLFVSALCLAACSDDPDVAPLKRDTDIRGRTKTPKA